MDSNSWDLQTVDLNPEEAKILKFINAATGHRNMELSRKITYMFSLYPFLVKHKDDDPELVHQMVLDGGTPMFSLDDITHMLKTIREELTTPEYMTMDISDARQRIHTLLKKQQGGGDPEPASVPKTNPPYDPEDDLFGATKRPGFVDKTRNGFYDRIALKLQSMYENTPGLPKTNKLDGLFWYIFLLYNLENMDIFGPGLSMALDAYVLGTRVLVDSLDEFFPKLLTMVGGIFPGGGLLGTVGGELITLVIGNILLLGTVIVSVSRKNFGDAFKNSLLAIPFIGDFLLTFALTAETQIDRINNYRHKYVNMLGQVSPRLERYADYWVPKLEPVTGPPTPFVTLGDIQDDVLNKVQEIPGVKEALNTANKLQDPSALVEQAQAQAISTAQRKLTEAQNKVQSAVQDKLSEAKAQVEDKVQSAVSQAQTQAQNKLIEAQAQVQDKVQSAVTEAQEKTQTAIQDKLSEAQEKTQTAVQSALPTIKGGKYKDRTRKRRRKGQRQ
jgi:hypothetical protein